jgi:hypothetical protein
LDASPSYAPWTSQKFFKGEGMAITPRCLDILDLVTIQKCVGLKDKSPGSVRRAMDAVYCDTSQSHARHCFTNASGINHTATTSTDIYSFGRDSVLTPFEVMLLHGHPSNMEVPSSLSVNDLRSLAGEGMALPSLASVLWSLYLVKGFQ